MFETQSNCMLSQLKLIATLLANLQQEWFLRLQSTFVMTKS